MNITKDYDGFINCTDNENKEFFIIIQFLLLSIPVTLILISFIGLIIYKTPKLL